MGTRLKSKSLSLLAFLISMAMIGLALLAFIDVIKKREFLDADYYFSTPLFTREMAAFYQVLESYEFTFRDYSKTASLVEKLGGNEQYTKRKQELEANYKQEIESLKREYDDQILAAQEEKDAARAEQLSKEKAAKLAETKQKEAMTIRQQLIEQAQAMDRDFDTIDTAMTIRQASIKYRIQDTKYGGVYTNLPANAFSNYLQEKALYILKFPQASYADSSLQSINKSFQQNGWQGYFIIPKAADGFSQIEADYTYYQSIRERLLKESVLCVAGLLTAIALLFYLKKIGFFHSPLVESCSALLGRIPLELQLLIFIVSSRYLLEHVRDSYIFRLPLQWDAATTLAVLSLFFTYLSLAIKQTSSGFKNKAELHQLWRRSISAILYDFLRAGAGKMGMMFKVILLVALTVLFGVVLCYWHLWYIWYSYPEPVILLFPAFYILFYLMLVLPYILQQSGQFIRILKGTEQIALGNLDFAISDSGRGELPQLARHINNMKAGVKKSMENQMKSERLKSELITNVSHDLKTPLTSIINYVDILRRDGLSAEQQKEYIDILDKKAERLRLLIDDLFEASKAASGSVELNMERVDLTALLNQALAECNDKIAASFLTFRVKVDKPKIYAFLDGKKTWRVLENLITNALKYSQPNTRIYISLAEQEDKVVLTMQNISAYEIDFDVDEIFDRFKRGDTSRNTEGSGLGLAIAKSLVELQGGQLAIDVDGDQFKVTLSFFK